MKPTNSNHNPLDVVPVSTPPDQDIPAAQRQSSVASPAASSKQSGSWGKIFGRALGALSLGAIATLIIWQWQPISQQATKQTKRIQTAIGQRNRSSRAQTNQPTETDTAATAQPDSTALPPLPTPSPNPVATETPDQLLNHRRYAEAPVSDLVALNPNSQLKLQPPVQAAVTEMIAKAKAEGVQLGIASAFRTVEDQNRLFFEVKAERGQSSKTRAEVSAPPGYSEHHTGYAVDFIDESKPGTHTEESFETTPAFKWLKQNAPAYSFEMSFPQDPNSPVGYEPWHWRYVGDQKSLELFYQEQSAAEPATP